MQELDTTQFVAQRKATLSEIAEACGIIPLRAEDVRRHMHNERVRAPRPSILGAFLVRNYEPAMTVAVLLAMAIGMIGGVGLIFGVLAASSPPVRAEYAMLRLQGFALASFGLLMMGSLQLLAKKLDKRVFVTEYAHWDTERIIISALRDGSTVVAQAENAAYLVQERLRAAGFNVEIVRHTLRQNTVVLDPVIELRVHGFHDSLFVAIYDEQANTCQTAALR